ncbi:MAG: KUP/HAK/KT family potassium transporter [Crocinitomicaceae bacterium]|nr:KUP/HAK/KT family potassium transporter [Crocinitomicaceae bacterium]MDG1734872.1 KUP/HAK/KT family potassium transporter [Crocinitomicaceae bacterium]MDG2505344.1 KUP/HAK/KT family potassium transporter [Crocinitomicaceae bacterium]
MSNSNVSKMTFAGILISTGIVFGDIGTSPLYVFQAITGGGTNISEAFILGGLSCVIWTLLLIATFKYVYFALNADNKGEGGIFALFALLKERRYRWIIIPALIGCSTLIADGFITPAISISSAVEGLNNIYPNLKVIPIVVSIVVILFSVQQFGTNAIGKLFGPVMVIWFLFLGYLGAMQIIENPTVLKALNPWWAFNLIVNVNGGFWVLGAVFLCTTGAEALYSDLGHCGKDNIRVSWAFVASLLVTNYMGQAALCLSPGFTLASGQTVFYSMVPESIMPFAIGIATVATVIASQALITGVFTLMNEAIKLKLWTNLKVKYPSDNKGQIYIPFINWFLMFGCLLVIFIFKKSSAMEHTYGLAITIDMVMTSILLGFLLLVKYPKRRMLYLSIFLLFILIEGVFLMSNLGKVVSGGWFTLVLAATFFSLLFLYNKARELRTSITEYESMKKVIPLLNAVKNDDKIPFDATNLVFPTRSNSPNKLDTTVFHSLFNKKPRKAGIVWFLHLDIQNEPWGVHYSVNEIIDKSCYYVSLQLGFKEEHHIEYMMRKIQRKMVEKNELSGESVFNAVRGHVEEVDYRFVVINSRVAIDNDLTPFQNICVKAYRFVKSTGLKPAEDFGLDKTNVTVDYVPISVTNTFEQEVIEDFEDYSVT